MARLQKKSRRQSPQVQPNIRHSLRDGFTASFVLSLVRRAFWPPYPREAKLRRVSDNALTRVALDTSIGVSGPHDFSVRHATSHLREKRLMVQRPPPPRL